jgi:hypothetical protein
MRQIECPFESDVLCAVLQSRWPNRVDAELKAHAEHCEICSDVATVAAAIECAREETVAEVNIPHSLPESGSVWWKAQMRARREAIETAAKPITAVQIVAFAAAMVIFGVCIGATSSWVQSGLKWAWTQVASSDFSAFVPYATALITSHALLVGAMLAMIFVVPVAVWLAIGRE